MASQRPITSKSPKDRSKKGGPPHLNMSNNSKQEQEQQQRHSQQHKQTDNDNDSHTNKNCSIPNTDKNRDG